MLNTNDKDGVDRKTIVKRTSLDVFLQKKDH
jgi:hypothetical protein